MLCSIGSTKAQSEKDPSAVDTTTRSTNLTDHILRAVGVRNAETALRIVLPFAIHHESVAVLTRR